MRLLALSAALAAATAGTAGCRHSVPAPVPVAKAPGPVTPGLDSGPAVHVPLRAAAYTERQGLVWTILDLMQDDDGNWMLPGMQQSFDEDVELRVDADVLSALDSMSMPPAGVWLMGSDEPCLAELTYPALLSVDVWTSSVTVGFELKGCPGEEWGPVALFGEREQVEGLTWYAATAPVPSSGSDRDEMFADGPLVDYVAKAVMKWKPPVARADLRIEFAVVDTKPPVFELLHGAFSQGEQPCDDAQVVRSAIVVAAGQKVHPVLCANRLLDYDCRWTELRGAIARQGAPVALVAVDNWYSILLYPMAGVTDFGGEPEQWQSLATTTTYDEDRRSGRNFADYRECADDGPGG